ncbi:MAG: hypothetical protein ABI852_17250 [Gemmatimonadaceae bacterium]
MHKNQSDAANSYPTGRGYGNDYMRGGEVFGGYGYSSRPEYEMRRGDTAENELRKLQSNPEEEPSSPPP